MKILLLLLFFTGIIGSSWSQDGRKDISGIEFIEVKLKDSTGVFIMIWDDFTFNYDENHSEIVIIEGYSKKKQRIKAKEVDWIAFAMFGSRLKLHQFKSLKRGKYLLLSESYRNGQYTILQSPEFSEPIFYYLGHEEKVAGLLPTNNMDFLNFFNCSALVNQFSKEENKELTLEEMKIRLDFYLANCFVH